MEYPVTLVEIASAMRSIVSEGQIVELRALKVPCGDGIRRTFSGYFDNVDVMAQAAAALTQKGASGVYFTPNPVKKSVKTTRLNEVGPCSRGEQAHDVDIQEVKWILIDIDPERPAGMSATAEEKAEAERVCKNVLEVLTTRGWPDPLMGDSGNGFHLMYRVEDVPSSTIREALDTLAFLCNEDGAKVDQLVFNPSRIWKVYGTWARKGEDDSTRPWRKAKLLNPGKELVPVSKQQLEGLLVCSPTPTGGRSGSGTTADLDNWIKQNLPQLGAPKSWQGKGRRWVFDVCPWDSSHTDRSAYIVQFNNGAIAAGCLHANCKGHETNKAGKHLGWKRLQELVGVPFKSKKARAPSSTTPSTVANPNLTDLGNAKRMVRMFQGNLLHCPTHGMWYQFDDCRWKRDMDGGVHRMAKATVGTIFTEAEAETDPNKQADIYRHALRSESSRSLNSMVNLASTEIDIAVEASRLDADPWLFNVANGTLNLKNGRLQDHDRMDFITKASPVVYNPNAKCPVWDEFLSYSMEEDQEVIDFLHRFFGYCLTGLVTEQVLLFMEGTGGNGKTTALLALMHVLGDYAIQGAPGLLLAKQGESHPTEVADLEAARFVANAEVEKGKPFAEALIKQLTGSDPIRARKMRQDFYQFMPTHKLCIAANHRPIIKGNDEGIWRRVIRIPWKRKISSDKKDPFLLEKLRAEAPGILAKLVEGCLAWQKDGLQPPARVTLATDEYREEMDVLAEFMEEQCIIGIGQRVALKDLYLAYAAWCDELNQRPQNYRLFNRQMRERNYSVKVFRHGGRVAKCWEGIGLRDNKVVAPTFISMRMGDA